MSAPTAPACIDDALDWLRKRFRPDAAEGLCVTYRLELGGDDGGVISVRVDRGRLEAAAADPGAADVVFRLTAHDFFDVLAGRANPDLLHMDDRLEVEGDFSLALKLRKLFGA